MTGTKSIPMAVAIPVSLLVVAMGCVERIVRKAKRVTKSAMMATTFLMMAATMSAWSVFAGTVKSTTGSNVMTAIKSIPTVAPTTAVRRDAGMALPVLILKKAKTATRRAMTVTKSIPMRVVTTAQRQAVVIRSAERTLK